jgi:plasmid rolling circle replication initiator protein Rep
MAYLTKEDLFLTMDNYNIKKKRTQQVTNYIDKHVSLLTEQRICSCGSWLEFLVDKDMAKKKLHNAMFCENRFCPMCAWRKARKDALMIGIMIQWIEEEYGKDFIFVTFTAPNVKGDKLRDEISNYNKAFYRLLRRDEIIAMNQGFVRKLEVTFNAIRDDYHPHFHVIFAVNKGYFKNKEYIKQSRWLELWQEAMRDDSITQVDVRRVKKTAGGDERSKAIYEVAKYAAKDEDYTRSQEVFDVFYKSLKGRQVLTFGGLFKEAVKKYKSKELEHYKTVDETEYIWQILYTWGGSEYAEKRRRELTPEERTQFNNTLIQEAEVP